MPITHFTSIHVTFRRLANRLVAATAISATVLTLAACQDIPIARQRLSELIAPRNTTASAAAASGASAVAAQPASGANTANAPQRKRPRSSFRDDQNQDVIEKFRATGYGILF
ncbi:hypothetical protein WL30_12405 [Burkholderia ubonensis]|uniref:hypothetical protein n=1 Tax=Burkholderia ubonensis TaxID=101571 RepID=UPI00075A81C8|nr:hypothetical protein [Burkholderia ubonensis]KWA72418.1 hypothetical protein WL30_12405 [Burkholderia ubonensis]KWB18424.1 hypothetical protein WL31_10505 [Burkholderia ubonensis]